MLNLIKSIVITLSAGIFLLLMSTFLIKTASSDELLNIDEVKIQYKDFFSGGRDPLVTQNGLPNKALDKELNLILNSNVLSYGFWNNTIHSMTDKNIDSNRGQFRTIAWSFGFGIRLTKILNISYEHRSQHLLDHVWPYGGFPVKDAIMFEINLYSRQNKESLFNF